MITASKRRTRTGNNLVEFGPVLFVIFVVILLPLSDLVTYLCGVSTVQLVVTEGSRAAATGDTPSDALKAMEDAARKSTGSALGAFAKLVPIQGVNNSGCRLSLKATSATSGEAQLFEVPKAFPLPDSVRPEVKSNKSDFIYQYEVTGRFMVSPLIDLSSLPGLKGVPIVTPSEITYTAAHAVENLQGLNAR